MDSITNTITIATRLAVAQSENYNVWNHLWLQCHVPYKGLSRDFCSYKTFLVHVVHFALPNHSTMFSAFGNVQEYHKIDRFILHHSKLLDP